MREGCWLLGVFEPPNRDWVAAREPILIGPLKDLTSRLNLCKRGLFRTYAVGLDNIFQYFRTKRQHKFKPEVIIWWVFDHTGGLSSKVVIQSLRIATALHKRLKLLSRDERSTLIQVSIAEVQDGLPQVP